MLRHLFKNAATIQCRNINLSIVQRVKELQIKQEEGQTTIWGNLVESPRKNYLINFEEANDNHKDACPLCRLNLPNLTYKDVLILNQFVEEDGSVMPFEQTKLCGTKYYKVQMLVRDAQKARLMKRPAYMKAYGPWDQLNSYLETGPKRFRDQPMRMIKPDYWN